MIYDQKRIISQTAEMCKEVGNNMYTLVSLHFLYTENNHKHRTQAEKRTLIKQC